MKNCLGGLNVEILVSITLLDKECFLQKWLIPGQGQGMFQVRLEHLGMLESKDVLQDEGDKWKGHGNWLEGAPTGQTLASLNINKNDNIGF